MEWVVRVNLHETGKQSDYYVSDFEVHIGDECIVEHDKGLDAGIAIEVLAPSEATAMLNTKKKKLLKVLRKVSQQDREQIARNHEKSQEAKGVAEKNIDEKKLPMKVIDAEYSFDRSKLIIYFSAEHRVDFRNLVKDLVKFFRTRIELRQIGVRDETRFLGGLGPCGRALCCYKILKGFKPVTIKMAKEQKLSLNPTKISGLCGRLMCCLGYEYEVYREFSKGLPKEGQTIKITEGMGKVSSVNVLKRTYEVTLPDGRVIKVKL